MTPFEAGHASKRLKKRSREARLAFPGIHISIEILTGNPRHKGGVSKEEYEDYPKLPSQKELKEGEP